ncbi:MAG: prolyl oligopeptidase family serine peptidase [Proteiniphilum sp.]|nr:prolyl oligopeptidase family serine peptidase [Proteiniphilum sp.]
MHCFSQYLTARGLLMLLLLLTAAVGTSHADNTPEYTMQSEGIERTYRLHIPENMPENGPLVIVLHGYGNPNPGNMNETADRHLFAACYPQGEKDSRGKACWNVGYPFQHDMTVDDVEFLTQLVHQLQQKHGFSKQDVFCVGMSNGGEMCYQVAAQRPGLFAAVAPVSGLMMEWLYKSDNATHPVSLFEIHGTEDRTSAWQGDPDNKGGWGEYMPVPLAVHFWAAKNRCTVMQTDTIIGKAPNHRKIVKHRFSGGLNNSEVWLYEVIGGGHSWFWDDMETGDELWKFFSKAISRKRLAGISCK